MKDVFELNSRQVLFGMLIRNFNKYRNMPPSEYIWKVTLEQFLVSIALFLILLAFIPYVPRTQDENTWVLATLIAPIVETFIGQAIPVYVCSKFTSRFKAHVASAWIVFALMHYPSGAIPGLIVAGIVGGFYYAFTYCRWLDQSSEMAFGMTAAQHFLYNFILFVIVSFANFMAEPPA